MARFVRTLTTVFFVASLAISLALLIYAAQWSDERGEMLREVRTVVNGLAIAGFCITLFTGKKRTKR